MSDSTTRNADSDAPSDGGRVNRRTYLRTAGATGAALATAGCLGGLGGGGTPTINILTWEEYGDDKIQSRIEDTVGVNLEITKSTSSSKMFSSWNAGQYKQYDIAIPNNNYVPKMMDADLVAPVNEDVLTNQGSIYDTFQKFQDSQFTASGNTYGVPIRFGWYGYSYDSRKLPEDHEKSYDVLFSEQYEGTDLAGSIIMYDNHFKAMSAAALHLGFRDAFSGSKVSLSEQQIGKVKDAMIEQKKLLQGYIAADPSFIKSFRQGNFVVGQSGRNEIVEMRVNGDSWPRMAAPKEGALAWFESAVVSKASKNTEKAWEVVNEYISPKNGARLAQVGYSPSVNPKTQQHLTAEQNDLYGAIEPSRLKSMIPFKAVENEESWITAWEEVKSA